MFQPEINLMHNRPFCRFTENDYQVLLFQFKDNKRAEQIFSNNYDPGDIAAATFSQDSAKVWSISPPDRQKMIEEVNSSKCHHNKFIQTHLYFDNDFF